MALLFGQKPFPVEQPNEVLGSEVALAVVRLSGRCNEIPVAVVALRSGHDVIHDERVRVDLLQRVEAAELLALQDRQPILGVEEVDLLNVNLLRCGWRRRDYPGDLTREMKPYPGALVLGLDRRNSVFLFE